MKRNIEIILRKSLQRLHATKSKLFNLNKRASNHAAAMKPLSAVANNIAINGELKSSEHYKVNMLSDKTSSNGINSVQYNKNLYHSNKASFDCVFNPLKQIDITAYCSYVNKQGIAGFVDIDNIPYFQISVDELISKLVSKPRIHIKEQNELLSIYILLKLYTYEFKGKRVQIYCDNLSVINMLNDYEAKESTNGYLQLLVDKIAMICMEYRINIRWSRIGGVPLIIVDRLARSISNPFQYSEHKPQSKPNPLAYQHLNNLSD